MSDKNIFVYKLFFSINISKPSLLFNEKTANPLNNVTPPPLS